MQHCSKDINFSLKQNTCFNSLGTTKFYYKKFFNAIVKITEINDCLLCTVIKNGKHVLETKDNIVEIIFDTPDLELNGYIFPQQSSGSIGQVLTLTASNTIDFQPPKIILEDCLECNDNGDGTYDLITKPDVKNITLESTNDITINPDMNLKLNNYIFPDSGGNPGNILYESNQLTKQIGWYNIEIDPDNLIQINKCLECPGNNLSTKSDVENITLNSGNNNLILNGYKFPQSNSGSINQTLTLTSSNTIEFKNPKTELNNCLLCQNNEDGTYNIETLTTQLQNINFTITGVSDGKINLKGNLVDIQSDGQDLSFTTNGNEYILPKNAGNELDVLHIESQNSNIYTLNWVNNGDRNCLKCIEDPQKPGFYDFTTQNVRNIELDPIFEIKLNGNQTEIVNSISGPNNSYILPKILNSLEDNKILSLKDSTTNNTSEWETYGF